jgi:hypothetical protein
MLKLLPIFLCLLASSCGKPSYDDPRRNRLTGVATNVLGKWETLMVKHVPRSGARKFQGVWPEKLLGLPYREVWGTDQTGKGFEFCPAGALRVYSFTNATPPGGRPASTFSLTATGQYSLTNGILEVRLNGEVVSTPFPPVPRTDYVYKSLPMRMQSEMAGAIYLALTNEAGAAGSIGLLRVSKFKFE